MAIGEFTRTMPVENPSRINISGLWQRLFAPLDDPELFHYSGCDNVNPHPELEDIYRKFGRVHITRVINKRKIKGKIERKIVVETVVIDYPMEDSGEYRSVTFDFDRKDGMIIGTIKDVVKQKQRLGGTGVKRSPAVEITEKNISLAEECVKDAEKIYEAIDERYKESRKKQVTVGGFEPSTSSM